MKLVQLMIENPNATAACGTVFVITLAVIRLMIIENKRQKVRRV